MSPLGKFSLRLALYGLVIAYLAGDLFVFHGPLRRRMDRADPNSAESLAAARERGVVARVFNHQITRSQLERALHERLWLEGKTPESLPPELLKTARYAALDDLLDHELLRIKAKAHATRLKVEDHEIDEGLRAFAARFEDRETLERAMKSQGIKNTRELCDRIAARIQQEKYVELKIGPLSTVSEEEAREWYEENQDQLATPERIEARHIFLPTLEQDSEKAKEQLEAALASLLSKQKDFDTLAREISADPATKDSGGRLGWMTRDRMPTDFTAPVFSLALNQPTLVRTKLGWHLVEVTGRMPAATQSFEEAKPEVLAALRAVKRNQAANDFRIALRRFEAAKIDVFHDMIHR